MSGLRNLAIIAAIVAFALPMPAKAQHRDVTFFVIGKHGSYEQRPDGTLAPVDFSFFSEIFFTEGGDASGAFLATPAGERLRYRDMRLADGGERDNLLLVRGVQRFPSYDALQSWYPDGDYVIDFDTPSGPVDDAVLGFPVDGLPRAPRITLSQGAGAGCFTLDGSKDLNVGWTPFSQGSADPNGILDDLIFVIVEDDSGVRVAHSGRPFEGKPFLTYRDSAFTVPARTLEAGRQYELSVEHASLNDTARFDGVPAMTTYAVTTRLELSVGDPVNCDSRETATMPPTTDGQVVMFYYEDLAAADRFYGETLGFVKTLDEDWVKFYRTSGDATVGLVADGAGAWHKPQPKNAVMLSIVTSEVDAWYERLRKMDDVTFLKDIGDGGPIRSFLVEDPGGYTVEFFQWK